MDVVIGTPGRIMDLMDRGSLSLSDVSAPSKNIFLNLSNLLHSAGHTRTGQFTIRMHGEIILADMPVRILKACASAALLKCIIAY